MMGKKANSGETGAPADVKAILGKGSEFEGKLRFEGTVRIDGHFKGEVNSSGTLIVGEAAVIEGDLSVNTAIISGEIRGNIKAKSKVELHAPAKLFGDLETPSLVVQEGVIFDGNCRMSKEGAGREKSVWGAEKAIPIDSKKDAAQSKSE